MAYTIQTNGTRLNDAWCVFFKRHGFLVGLSIDGPADLHDAYRIDKGGAGTFADVMRGWEMLNRHGVDVNILCSVHAANAEHPLEVYRLFRDELKRRSSSSFRSSNGSPKRCCRSLIWAGRAGK